MKPDNDIKWLLAVTFIVIAVAVLAVVLTGCATVTTENMNELRHPDGTVDITVQKTTTLVLGKAGVDEATPTAESSGEGWQMTTGSTATGVEADWTAIISAFEKLAGQIIDALIRAQPLPDPEISIP